MGRADGEGRPDLLLRLGRTEGEDGRRTAVGLDDAYGFFHRTLLVGAHREAQEMCVDRLAVFGDRDPRPRSGDAFHADEDPHCFILASSGSNSGRLPTTATFTGNNSFWYMICRSLPSTACSGGR